MIIGKPDLQKARANMESPNIEIMMLGSGKS